MIKLGLKQVDTALEPSGLECCIQMIWLYILHKVTAC